MEVPEMETLSLDKADGITTLYLDRPEKMNAMNLTMFQELGTAAEYLRDDPETRVVVMTGRGTAFCSGLDLASMAEFASAEVGSFRTFVRIGQANFRAFELIEKPVLAMVNGHALGAGTEIALACDMILSSTEATFGLLEVNYGLVCDLGATQRLPRCIGIHKARELIMTGKKISAEEADDLGLLNRLLPPERLVDETMELARKLKELPGVAVGLCKVLIGRSRDGSIETGLELEAQAQSLCVSELLERMRPSDTGEAG